MIAEEKNMTQQRQPTDFGATALCLTQSISKKQEIVLQEND